jgi:hypothetical protein
MADNKADNKKAVPAKPSAGKASGIKQNIHSATPLFGKENYRWMLIGIIIMALGLILMAGGKSKDPNVFDPKEVYSFTRITLAPILILGGLALEIVAIFKKNKNTTE